MRTRLLGVAGVLSSLLLGVGAQAISSLQLAPGTGSWTYDVASQTWLTSDNPLELMATANATTGNGEYAWNTTSSPQYAYLVVAAVPPTTSGDAFDITISNDGGALAVYTSGVGNAPLQDTNDLPAHGVYDTYFEIYEFNFDGPIVTIGDTQPGETGTGDGYEELFDIAVMSLAPGVTRLQFDLFTVRGSGQLNLAAAPSRNVVNAYAPFSHDAQAIPEPGAVGVFSLGLLAAGALIHLLRPREA